MLTSVLTDLGRRPRLTYPLIALTAAVLLTLAFGTAQGATVTVFSGDDTFAAWTAAAGTPVVEDFADPTVVPGFSITFGSGLPGSIGDGVYHDRADDLQATKPVLHFSPPIRAFGATWDLRPGTPGRRIKLYLTFADSTTMAVGTEVPETFTGQFFGIVSDTAIVSIRLDEGTREAAGITVETFDMDNARFVQVPVAQNDAYSTNEDTTLDTAGQDRSGVLVNDTGGDLTAELVAAAEHGSVTLNTNGHFTYVPNPNFNGLDSFLYVAKKGGIESNIAMVTITVNAVNDPPFFNPIPDQFVNPPVGVNQTVDLTGLSPGPANESGQTLTITAESSKPALISNPIVSGEGSTRTLTYQRLGSGNGTATITVTAQDNGGTTIGGADTFSRTFDITLGAAAAVQASVTSFTPNADPTKAPTVTVTVTASPIDFDGNGRIECPADAYRFFPPRPAPSQPFNVIPSNADKIPEAPPWRIPEDTVEVCSATLTFPAVLDLSEWKTGATGTTDIAYVSIVRDLERSPDGACPPGATCFDRIWTGVKPAGSITFNAADKVAVKNTVTLKTFDSVTKASTSTALPHIPIRVFDIKNPELQAVAANAIKSTAGGEPTISFSLLSQVLGKIFEADKGRTGTCQTDDSGLCFASQAAPAYDLIIAKFFDHDTGKTVYVGDIKRPRDFVNGIAVENLVIVKQFKNGVFAGYAPGILLRVE